MTSKTYTQEFEGGYSVEVQYWIRRGVNCEVTYYQNMSRVEVNTIPIEVLENIMMFEDECAEQWDPDYGYQGCDQEES